MKSCIKLFLVYILISTAILFTKSEVYFSPRDNIKNVVLNYIQNEEKSIKAAIYWITEKDYIEALIDAAERGVSVELIVDKEVFASKVQTFRENIFKLCDSGVVLHVCSFSYGIMHNKFCVFEKNKGYGTLSGKKRSIAYTGSFNWTWKANYANSENVIFTDKADVVKKYIDGFGNLLNEIILAEEKKASSKKKTRPKRNLSYSSFEDEEFGLEEGFSSSF